MVTFFPFNELYVLAAGPDLLTNVHVSSLLVRTTSKRTGRWDALLLTLNDAECISQVITLNYFSCSEKPKSGAGKMAHWIHVLAVKPDDVSSIPRTHIVGKNQLSLSTCTVSVMYPRRRMCKTKEPKSKAKPINKQTNQYQALSRSHLKSTVCSLISLRGIYTKVRTLLSNYYLSEQEDHTILLNASFISLVVHWMSEN